ncbi:MAG: antibiotic biosynthesis monooxygenase family protein [Mobilitalea sp.]
MKEYDSDFCKVKYIEEDNVVLLTWKKYACGEDYRKPTTFAWELMKEHLNCKFIVDARDGFEDDKEDVEWGFSVLLPGMAQTSCKLVCFIMKEISEIENEMDMWTMEFGKYFAVGKALNYREAVDNSNRLFMLQVTYRVTKGKRDEFYRKVKEQKIIQHSKEEPGNYKYDYYFPVDSEEDLCLMELWTGEEAQKLHMNTEHFHKLTQLKQEYVESVEIEKYWITKA